MKTSKIYLFTGLFFLILLQQCGNYQDGSKTDKITIEKRNSNVKSLPHGSADVVCTIIDSSFQDGKNYYTIEIDSVFGYGASARPLGTGSKWILDAGDTQENSMLEINKKYRLTVISLGSGIGMEKSNKLKLFKISK